MVFRQKGSRRGAAPISPQPIADLRLAAAQMSGEIYTSSRTLARLVDDLLDFSHLDHGRLQLRRRRIALSELLESLARTFGTQAGGERITTDLAPSVEVQRKFAM